MAEDKPAVAQAAAWMLLGIFALSAVAVAGREVSSDLDTFELMLYRSLLGVPVVWALARWRGETLKTERLPLHFLRNVFHFTAQNLWFYALALIPLAQVFALEFTTPIWVVLLAPLALREPLTRVGLIAVLLGFLGILVIVRPGIVPLEFAHGATLLSALGFAGTVLSTKLLSGTENTFRVLFYMTLMQSGLALLCAAPGGIALPVAANLPWILVLGLCGIGAHFCITQALRLAPASVVSPLDFVRLPFIAVVGMLLYGEPIEWAVFAGGALIVAGNLLNIRSQGSDKSLR